MADMNAEQDHKSVPADKTSSAKETEHPTSGQLAQPVPEMDTLEDSAQDYYESESDIDPADQIVDFDWGDLHQRYHDAMRDASQEEAELLQEFARLMDYFKIWAEAGANQESDRTFHRLHTRMSYVQHSEDKLEQTRQHYIGVVQAFERALSLLRNSGLSS